MISELLMFTPITWIKNQGGKVLLYWRFQAAGPYWETGSCMQFFTVKACQDEDWQHLLCNFSPYVSKWAIFSLAEQGHLRKYSKNYSRVSCFRSFNSWYPSMNCFHNNSKPAKNLENRFTLTNCRNTSFNNIISWNDTLGRTGWLSLEGDLTLTHLFSFAFSASTEEYQLGHFFELQEMKTAITSRILDLI